MAVYLILGAGKFGQLALQRLPRHDAAAAFVVVDQDPGAIRMAQSLGIDAVTGIHAEAIGYLAAHLRPAPPWDWLLPMLPVHVAYEWLRRDGELETAWRPTPVPEALAALAPVAFRGRDGQLYLSRAEHLCPDDCPEPPQGCPVSGRHWDRPLYDDLSHLALPGWRPAVIRSTQLAPGIGGYPPRLLLDLAEALRQCPSDAGVLLATACRCHGVVHALKRESS